MRATIVALLLSFGAAAQGPDVTQLVAEGLTDDERRSFYHLSEGGAILPLYWYNHMEVKNTGETFRERAAFYGFLDDIEDKINPEDLPIGLTVERPGDLFRIKAVSINCAACHVANFEYSDQIVQVVGAPNMIDVRSFAQDIVDSARATFTDLHKLAKLLRNDPEVEHEEGLLYDSILSPTMYVVGADRETVVPDSAKPQLEAAIENFRIQIDDLLKEPLSNEDPNAVVDLLFEEESFIDPEIDRLVDEAVNNLLSVAIARSQPTSEFLFGGDNAEEFLRKGFHAIARRFRLHLARGRFLKNFAALDTATHEGYGRLDAFGTVRRLVFWKHAKGFELNAPASIPHLWNFKDTKWLHWNANSNSVMQRNIAQSLGVGAIMTDKFEVSSRLRNIHDLELLAQKIEPPAWPDVFPPIDTDKLDRGAKLFKDNCARCHNAATWDNSEPPLRVDPEFELSEVQTDAAYIEAFSEKLTNGEAYHKAIETGMAKAKENFCEVFGVNNLECASWDEPRRTPVIWRAPKKYPARPLDGIWATAPYLHNNSVPTLYDLLTPPDQRPKVFAVGQREYDPVKVGFAQPDVILEPYLYRTHNDTEPITGNSNLGHDYGTDLSDDDKFTLIEYLKMLPPPR